MKLKQTVIFLIGLAAIVGIAEAQTQSQDKRVQDFLNPNSGCYERLFRGDEAERTVPASEIIAAINQNICLRVAHAVIQGILDFTSIAPTPATSARKIIATVQITDSEIEGIQAGAFGDAITTVFVESVSFSGSRIKGDAEFVNVTFESEAVFQDTVFSGTVALNGTRFEKAAHFAQAQFEQIAFFFGTQFKQDAIFTGAQFKSTVRLFDAEFKGVANFQNTLFQSTTDLSDSRFEGRTFFTQAHFVHAVMAKSSEFVGSAHFDAVRADDGIDFSNARFADSVVFNRATLNGARFFSTRFSQRADFSGTRFLSDTNYNSAFFGAISYFLGTDFEQAALLSNSVFLGDALFMNARFADELDLSFARFSSHLGPDFTGARLEKTLNLENTVSAGALRLTWEQVNRKLGPETPQILSLLEKSFVELGQGEDAVAACEASAKWLPKSNRDIMLLRCTMLAAQFGLPLRSPDHLGGSYLEKQPDKKAEKNKIIGNLLPAILVLTGIVILALLLAKGGRL